MRKIQLILLLILAVVLSVNAQNGRDVKGPQKNIYISKQVEGTMDEVYEKVVQALKEHKFGVITEVDMAKTLKEKIDVDIMPYKILGVCNPGSAYEALQAEPNIGVFLPCKVILKQLDENTVEVVSANPEMMMQMLENRKLDNIAKEVSTKLEKVVLSL